MRKYFWLQLGAAAITAVMPWIFAVSILDLTDRSALLLTPETIDYSTSDAVEWKWHDQDRECKYFLSCTLIEVENTDQCPDQIFIPMFVSDELQNRVTWSDLILDSPKQKEPTVVELGVNIEDFR